MEAAGAPRLTHCLFETGMVVIGEQAGNDDSSCHMVMRIDQGKMVLD
jgi:hypothetical protein